MTIKKNAGDTAVQGQIATLTHFLESYKREVGGLRDQLESYRVVLEQFRTEHRRTYDAATVDTMFRLFLEASKP